MIKDKLIFIVLTSLLLTLSSCSILKNSEDKPSHSIKKDKVLIEKPDIVIEKHLPDTAIVPKPTIPDAPPVDKKMDDKPRILDLNDIDPNRHAPRR
jgi:hypothetical protein